MPEVDLSIVAHNEQYISSVKEASSTYQQFHDNIRSGEKEEQGLINSTVQAIKQYEDARNKAMSTTDIDKYNKKIAEAKQKLTEYNKIGTETPKTQASGWQNVTSFLRKAVAAIGIYHLAVQAGKAIIGATEELNHKWEVALKEVDTALGFVATSIASMNFEDFWGGLERAIEAGKKFVDIQGQITNRTNSLTIATAEEREKFAELRTIYMSSGNAADVRMKALKEAQYMQISLDEKMIALAKDDYNSTVDRIGAKKNLSEIDKKNIEYIIKNYEFMQPVIKQAEEYNKKLEEKNRLQKMIESGNIDLFAQIDEQKRAEEEANKKGGVWQDYFKQPTIESVKEKMKNITDELLKLSKNASGQNVEYWATAIRRFGLTNEKERAELTKLYSKVSDIQFESTQKLTRNRMIESSIEKEELDKLATAEKKALEERLKRQEEFQKMSQDIVKRYNATLLESVTGKDRIQLERTMALTEIDALKARMSEYGTITAEQERMIQAIKQGIITQSNEKIKKLNEDALKTREEQDKKILVIEQKIEEDQVDLIEGGEIAKLNVKQKYLALEIQRLNKKGDIESKMLSVQLQGEIDLINKQKGEIQAEKDRFTIYDLLGIDTTTELGKEQAQMVDDASAQIVDAINKVMDADIKAAEQRTQLLDDQLKKKESVLNKEQDLAEKGLANNVDVTKREIALLNQEKKKALEQEKKLKKEQIAVDVALQTSKLILSGVELFQSQASKGIVGVIIAAGLIASMYGIIASANAQAKALEAESTTELEEGGTGTKTGMIKGKRHSQGGEYFLNHISVEDGEKWAVWNRGASHKFGSVIPAIVESMNNMKLPDFMIRPDLTRTQNINIETQKMEKKLDSINDGIKVLNENFLNQNQTLYQGKTRIQKLSKNHIRIIDASK